MASEPVVRRAAGILFLTPAGKVLFLKRGPGGDAPGAWCFPGGGIEGDETPEQAALREATEELGEYPKGMISQHCRTITPASEVIDQVSPAIARVDFTTFLQRTAEEFTPTLNGEHTGWAWADLSQPPAPLHPGCRVALDKLSWDELGVARAMRDGLLTSPQRYANVWLFDMRITGTGVSYRGPKYDDDGRETKSEEFVYRRPENYLTDEFLQRCAGLQVIMMHPAKALLNSKEFGARTVGAMMLPYVKGDEVWGVAKVYDEDAVRTMLSRQMSTSPAVLLGGGDHKMKTEDGTDLLIEGKPSLLDHLAICERGVWDKGGDPSGVRTDNQTGDTPMDKEQLAALKAEIIGAVSAAIPGMLKDALNASTSLTRADDAGGAKLEKVLSAMDAVCGRMDDFSKRMDSHAARMDADEKERKDADDKDGDCKRMDGESDEDFEKRKSDKARKDAEEKEKADAEAIAADKAKKDAEEKEKADVADRHLSATTEMAKRLIAVERAMPKQLTDADRHAFAQAQSRADEVCQGFGKRAPFPLNGEDVLPYRKRLVHELKCHSPAWKDVDVMAIADEATFKVAESMVFKDAVAASLNPADLRDDELRAIVRVDNDTGVRTTEFRGRHSFVRSMTRPSRRCVAIGARKET